MEGEFLAGGVHCEQCHGMGSNHQITESAADISIDNSSAMCGDCHTRNVDKSIAASGGYIKHHEQHEEMMTSKHDEYLTCNTCHDPHASTKRDDEAKGDGIRKTCTECHSDVSTDVHMGASCVTCHMPKASKSALATHKYAGDIKTHIFKINMAADGEMFNEDGSLANVDGLGVTLDFVCYQCHKDENQEGGSKSVKSMSELAEKAVTFHAI